MKLMVRRSAQHKPNVSDFSRVAHERFSGAMFLHAEAALAALLGWHLVMGYCQALGLCLLTSF